MEDKILVIANFCKTISYAMQQNSVPVVSRLMIKNVTKDRIDDIDISVEFDPECSYKWKTKVSSIEPQQIIEIDDIDVKISTDYLFGLSQRVDGNIIFKVSKGKEIYGIEVCDISILSYDEWCGLSTMPEMLSAFVTPDHPYIARLIKNAGDYLKEWGEEPSFLGYKYKDPNIVRKHMAAIYTSVRNENITYCASHDDYEASCQKIRMCDKIQMQKLASNLEMSLLYASCLEAAGLNPFVIFANKHILVGCMLIDDCFLEVVQDDVSLINKKNAEGVNEVCIVEPTCMMAGKETVFEMAVTTAQRRLVDSKDFTLFIDIRRSRNTGIKSLPIRIVDEEGHFIESEYKFILDKDELFKDNSEYMAKNNPMQLEIINSEEETDNILTKQELWERKLLDLSLRNTLINFRVNAKNIQLLSTDIAELAEKLLENIEYKIVSRPKDLDGSINAHKIYEYKELDITVDNIIEKEIKEKKICTFFEEKEVLKHMTNIYRQARTDLEENGANTLYLALGFLKWYETERTNTERYAPLVLLPIEIKRKTSVKGYVIKIREEEPQINITLLEMLKRDYDIQIPQLEQFKFVSGESGLELLKIFTIIRKAVMHKSRWDVCNYAFVGVFSFNQFIMWNDLKTREKSLKNNKIIASLIEGKLKWQQNNIEEIEAKELDDMSMLELAVPMSVDASQLLAVCQTAKNNSFVLHGPPGTGKSQTITNMIANALYQGKSVLFIAEKRAALSVVQKRLASIGLAPFCLELHSNKAKKKEVLEQLEQVLEITRTKAPKEYIAEARRLHCLRRELNDMVDSLHKTRKCGFSLYESANIAMKYENYPNILNITKDDAKEITKEMYDNWMKVGEELVFCIKSVGGVYNNPLEEFNITNYSKSLKKDIIEVLSIYSDVNENLYKAIRAFAGKFGIEKCVSHKKVQAVIKFARLLEEIDYMPGELIKHVELILLRDDIDEICACGNKVSKLKDKILEIFTEHIFEYDYKEAKETLEVSKDNYSLVRKYKNNKIIKDMKKYVKEHKFFKKEIFERYLDMLLEYDECLNKLQKEQELYTKLFGKLYKGIDSDFDKINTVYWQSVQLKKCLDILTEDEDYQMVIKNVCAIMLSDISEYKNGNAKIFEIIREEYVKLTGLEIRLKELAKIDFEKLHESNSWLQDMRENIDKWLKNVDNLKEWERYTEVREQMNDINFGKIIEAVEKGIINEDDIIPIMQKNISEACAYLVIEADEKLSKFSKITFEREIKRYKDANEAFENLTKKELVARLSSKVPLPSDSVAQSSEIGILKRAIKNGGRMLSIRKLFDTIPNLIRRLCPCMLMSPISVAQYINADYPQFDLVIFDEASQLPTCEAVGAISRGDNLVVVGDEKQLPPTSFFDSNKIDEDNMEKEDLDSILDDCLALSMPSKHLLWHYRSKHESLIAFSNRQYYNNKMYTFPSPKDLVSEVKFVPVKGYYDRGKTKQNLAEAKAVVEEIVRRLKDEELRKESIGVVTFSLVQQNLIEDLLMEEFEKDHTLDEINENMYEPIFIKNLENVQGDERDVIMFSIGYGPDQDGKVALNFGPLNRDGGQRRLNVAISRARSEMLIYSVLRPEQIDLSKTISAGVKDLKAFLEFAIYGKDTLPEKITQIEKKNNVVGIEYLVASEIEKLGYKVKVNIGCSKYKIDVGVINPNNEDEYVLGIMCDGENYRSAPTARDRNILQETVLKSLGWNIYKVWTLEWWDSSNKVIEQLKKAIEDAVYFESKKVKTIKKKKQIQQEITILNNENTKQQEETNINEEKNNSNLNVEEIYENVEKYTVTDLSDTGLTCVDSKEFLKKHNTFKIKQQMISIIKNEAPISKKLLSRRIYDAWGISRKGTKVDARIEEIASDLKLEQTKVNLDTFYWNAGQKSNAYSIFRIPTDEKSKRNLDEIAPQEISNAINYVLKNQVSMTLTDLEKEVAQIFGFSRNNKVIQMSVALGLEKAIDKGYVVIEGNRIIVKE